MKFALSLPVLALAFLLGRAQARTGQYGGSILGLTVAAVVAAATATEEGKAQEQLRGLHQDEASESAASVERNLANKCLTFAGNPRPNGWLCDKGRCYVNDKCLDGECVGDYRCPYDAQCQEPRECHAPSGTCYNPTPPGRALMQRELNDQPPINKPDGTPCDDGNPNSEDDQCIGGVCYGTEPVCTGEFNCVRPLQSVLPIFCSPPSIGSLGCLCSTTTEGKKFCWQSQFCFRLQSCSTSNDCPTGRKCVPNTCCDHHKKCLRPCEHDRRELEDAVIPEGECEPSASELCPDLTVEAPTVTPP